MGRRGRKAQWYQANSEPTQAREGIERRWYERFAFDDSLATLVTAAGSSREPYHRWLHYKNGFSPELVRRFLREERGLRGRSPKNPILDPFSGNGTTAIESAQRRVRALGIDAVRSLCFLANTRSERQFVEPPQLGEFATWREVADLLTEPIHRAALMCAVSRLHSSDGKPLAKPKPLHAVFAEVSTMFREDLKYSITGEIVCRHGDARSLSVLEDESISGILTSPPYLSRHDYVSITKPLEEVYQHWYPAAEDENQRESQVPAHPRATSKNKLESESGSVPAVRESCEAILEAGQPRLAAVVRAYFDDLFRSAREWARLLEPGAPCWVVIGGARLKDVYVPSDLILAEFVETMGLRVDEFCIARELIDIGRKLGRLRRVAPRESLLVMKKS